MENEAWDGTIEKIVKIVDEMEHDDTKDEVVQTPFISQCIVPSTLGTIMEITTQSSQVRTTSVHSTPRAQQKLESSPSSFTSPDPTLASLLSRKTRSL
jgi:hypothetical protein